MQRHIVCCIVGCCVCVCTCVHVCTWVCASVCVCVWVLACMCVYCLCECLALLMSSLSVSVLCSFKWSINDNTGSPNPYQGSSGSVVTEPWVDVISLLFCNSGMFSHFFNSNVLAPSLLAPQSNVHSNWLLTHPLTRHTYKYAHTRTVCRHKLTHAHTGMHANAHTHFEGFHYRAG
jgi:hypothetical protein